MKILKRSILSVWAAGAGIAQLDAESGWTTQNPQFTGNRLHAVATLHAGFAPREPGASGHHDRRGRHRHHRAVFTDGGATWSQLPSSHDLQPDRCRFRRRQYRHRGGSSGHHSAHVGCGRNLDAADDPVSSGFACSLVPGGRHGNSCGRRRHHSADRGLGRHLDATIERDGCCLSTACVFASAKTGIIVGANGTILRTVDGGDYLER